MSESPLSDPWSVARIEAIAPDGSSITVARELLRGDTFPQIEPTADGRGWWAVCQGTSDLYRVAVRVEEWGFACECSCPSRKYPCKHALAFLLHLADRPELRVTAEPARRAAMDFEGLVRAIFAQPDDDTPRLIFADYLDENDQPDRAALIRVQCERTRLPGTDPRVAELGSEEEELLARVQKQIGTLPEEFDIDFRRGFIRLRAGPEAFQLAADLSAKVANLFINGWVDSVRFRAGFCSIDVEAHSLLQRAGELDFSIMRQDDINLLHLATDMPVGGKGRLARICVHPADETLFRAYVGGTTISTQESRPPDWGHGLSWSNRLSPAQLERLLRVGRVEGVDSLTFYDPSFGDRGAEVLAGGRGLPLRRLTLAGSGIGPAGAKAIAQAEWFPGLETLSVSDCPFDNEGVANLGGPPGSTALTTLQLWNVGLDDAGLVTFASSPRFPAMESFDLERNSLTEKGAAAILNSEHFPRLKKVTLDSNLIPPEHQARVVLEARERSQQPVLEVSFGRLRIIRESQREGDGTTHRVAIQRADADVLGGLAGCRGLNRVTALTFEDSTLTQEAATAMASALSPEFWRYLDLTGCLLSEKPAAVVERFCAGHRLTTLDLTRTGLKYADVYKLSLCPALASVKVFDLSANPMGTGGLEAILSSPHLRGVERFIFKELNLTQRERIRFQKEFGKRAEF